jgi:hypothetical protein
MFARPITVKEQTIVKAFAYVPGLPESKRITGTFTRIPKNRKITISNPYSPQYSAGGDLAMINFIRGGENFRTGNWQGYEGVDFDATVDLGEVQEVKRLAAGFLQDIDSWIFFPEKIEFYISMDGINFTPVGTSVPETSNRDTEVRIHDFGIDLDPVAAQYVRVIATSIRQCPEWHPGAGKKAWLFADEIIIGQ